jgi:hypothetical protein
LGISLQAARSCSLWWQQQRQRHQQQHQQQWRVLIFVISALWAFVQRSGSLFACIVVSVMPEGP